MLSKKNKLDRQGFSLVEILVALGVLALLSLGVAVSVNQVFFVQKQISVADAGDNFSAAFFQHLTVPGMCEQMVRNKSLPSAGGEVDLEVGTFRGLLPDAPLGIKAGAEVDRGLKVNRLFAKLKPGIPQGERFQIGSDPATDMYLRSTLQVYLRLERKDANTGAVHVMPDRILELPVLSNATSPSTMQKCMVTSDNKDSCLVMGGTYSGGSCVFPGECKVHGTFIKTTCSKPNVPCDPEYTGPDRNNAITGTGSCPAGSCAVQSGRFLIKRMVRVGKKDWDPVDVTENFYICMSCPGSSCGK